MGENVSMKEKLAGRRVVASVSGGKDSAAMSLWLTEQDIEHDRVFMDTGWEHEVTYDYLRGTLTATLGPIHELCLPPEPCPCCAEAEGPCRICFGEGLVQGMVALCLRKGMFPSRVRRFCTQELKVKLLYAYLNKRVDAGEDVVNAVGIRRAESKARSEMSEWEWSDGLDAEVWRPLVLWSEADVIAIHQRHRLRPNPLYLMGASRVGCWPCIFARKDEVRLVADIDPARIQRIAALEAEVDAGQRARAIRRGGGAAARQTASFFRHVEAGRSDAGVRADRRCGGVVAHGFWREEPRALSAWAA